MFQWKTTIIPVKYSCKGLHWCGLRQLRSMSVKAYQISEQCLMLHCVECRILGEIILQLQYPRWVYMLHLSTSMLLHFQGQPCTFNDFIKFI